MAVLQLGDLRWRVDPNSVDWSFQLDTSVINTVGGQVIQILGATLSDLVIAGDFGQDHANKQESWQLANAFHQKVKSLMDGQTLPAKTLSQSQSAKRTGILTDAGPIHDPLPLIYHDGVHDWTFRVLIKSFVDPDGASLNIRTGKFSYSYVMTLFVVQADSDIVKKVASDYFLSRISEGLGWSQTSFNGPAKTQDAQDFILANGGSVVGYLDQVFSGGQIVDPSVAAPAPVQGGALRNRAQ